MRKTIGLLLVLLVITPAAAAGSERGPWGLGLDVGFVEFDSEVADESGALFGIRGGYHLTPRFFLEADLRSAAAEVSGVDVMLSTATINGVFCFQPDMSIVPYVMVGFGTANLEYEPIAGFTIDDDGSAYHGALGTRFHVGETGRHAVQVEVRYLVEETFDESSEHVMLSAGWLWRLGRR